MRELADLPTGLFGASTGAAAALVAAADGARQRSPRWSRAAAGRISRTQALPKVRAPTLLIVGGADEEVLELNRWAAAQMTCENALRVVPARRTCSRNAARSRRSRTLAGDWFVQHMKAEAHA